MHFNLKKETLKINSKSKILKNLLLMFFIVFIVQTCFRLRTFIFANNTILGLTELKNTGSYTKSEFSSGKGNTITSNGITVTTSESNNAQIDKNTAIKIAAESNVGITRIEAILYDAKTDKIVSSNFYVDSEGKNNSVVLSVSTPSVPIEKLLFKIKVQDNDKSALFTKTYLMQKSELALYFPGLGESMLSEGKVYFYADSSISSVPIKSLEYVLKEESSDKILKEGSYKLYDENYSITEEGILNYKNEYIKSGEGNFKALLKDSRIENYLEIPKTTKRLNLYVRAEDIFDNITISERKFDVKNMSIDFSVTPSVSNVELKVGSKIKVIASSRDTSGNSIDFGLGKLELQLIDSNGEIISKSNTTSHYTNGSKSLICEIAAVDKPSLSMIAIATDITGNTKKYGPVNYKVKYNEVDTNPIFKISSEPKMMGDSEEVSVTSNAGILFTELTVKITDSNGNIIRDQDNSLKISTISSSEGKTNLATTIHYPKTEKSEVYFVFSARDAYGNYYVDNSNFEDMSQVYKKGPIEIYSNRITTSVSPQTGIINANSNLKITSKVDVAKNPIEEISYAYYNKKHKIDSKVLIEGEHLAIYKIATDDLTSYEKEVKGTVKILLLDEDIYGVYTNLPGELIKYQNTLSLRKPYYEDGKFIVTGYISDSNETNKVSMYSKSSGYEVLSYGAKVISGVIATINVEGPKQNAEEIILSVKATDAQGKYKVTNFNYYQNVGNIKFESLPDSGIVYANGYIRAEASYKDAGCSIDFINYEVIDSKGKVIKKGSKKTLDSLGKMNVEFTMPEVAKTEDMKVKYTIVDSDNNIYKYQKEYEVRPSIELTDINNSMYKAIAGRLIGGLNEYIVEYESVSGELKTATLKSQTVNNVDYLYTNVKAMQLLSVSDINKVLKQNNLEQISSIEKVKKLYIKVNLDYVLTCRVEDNNEYIDIKRKVSLINNDNNYLLFKNLELDLGNGMTVNEVFDIDMRNEILSKAQKQEVREIDLNELGTNDKLIKIYNPEKLTLEELKEKKIDVELKFNDEYILSNDVISTNDIENGKLFNLSHEEVNNKVHLLVSKYEIENYAIGIEDNSVHKDHTYLIDRFGNISEICSSKCIIYDEVKTITAYYNATDYEKEVVQSAKAEISYKYKVQDGTFADANSGKKALVDDKGRIFMKIIAHYEMPDLISIIKENEYGDIGVKLNPAYSTEGNVKSFDVESEGRWIKISDIDELIGSDIKPKVSITPTTNQNALYYNKLQSRYERSSDRGNSLKFIITDASGSGIKDVKVSFKCQGEDDYSEYKTVANYNAVITSYKALDIMLPDKSLKYGGETGIKIIATNNNGISSEGIIYVGNKKNGTEFKVFINTTYGTNPLPLIKSESKPLINTNGTINDNVLNAIGEGKEEKTSAFRIEKVYDTKWVSDSHEIGVNSMALYSKNSINDTIGLGYRLQFALDTRGFGTDKLEGKADMLIVNAKFFVKENMGYSEVIPYVQEGNLDNYKMVNYNDNFRQLRIKASDKSNLDAVIGTNSVTEKDGKVTWRFSYYLPSNTKFKYKENLEGNFVDVSEVLVQFDIELYKYYSISSTGALVKDGTTDDSRHLYTLRENKWKGMNNYELEVVNKETVRNPNIRLRDLINTSKGCVFWYDVKMNATFDLRGSRSQ